jgi:hypothetical protein
MAIIRSYIHLLAVFSICAFMDAIRLLAISIDYSPVGTDILTRIFNLGSHSSYDIAVLIMFSEETAAATSPPMRRPVQDVFNGFHSPIHSIRKLQ